LRTREPDHSDRWSSGAEEVDVDVGTGVFCRGLEPGLPAPDVMPDPALLRDLATTP
jgi:hypothetical protein